MKKLLLTILFTLVLSGGAYAEEIILDCEFEQGQIIWNDGKIEAYSKSDSVKPKNKTLRINSDKKELFLFIDDISPINNNHVVWTNKVIKWSFENNISNTYSELNRYTGSLNENLIFKKKVSKINSRTHQFNCIKAEKKF